jgi:hypothetical protein
VGRRQKAESRKQKAESRKQKAPKLAFTFGFGFQNSQFAIRNPKFFNYS